MRVPAQFVSRQRVHLGETGTNLEEATVTDIPYRGALIVGAGSGISASVARGLARAGLRVGLAARNVDKLAALAGETGADYLLFGDWAAPLSFEEALERVRWWAELFTTPCVAFARSIEEARPFAAAGADFVMLGECVWNDPRGPAAALADARRALAG